MRIFAKVTTRLSGLKQFRRELRGGRRTERAILNAWDKRYTKFIESRFKKFSQGGGDWPPISEARAQRKGHNRILFDTGKLIGVWRPRPGPGGIRRITRWQVRRGYGGQSKYPGGARIAFVAFVHQEGLGRMPMRRIVVPPTQEVQRGMIRDARKEIRAARKRAGLRGR